MDQLGKRLKRTIVNAEGGSFFFWKRGGGGGGSGNMLAQRNFENVITRPFEAILDHFIIFFHLLKSKNFWRLYDTDKNYKWQTLNNPVISIRWFL